MATPPSNRPSPESAETLLAKNLVGARVALGWTQDALSAASNISRATIAQLETGISDPRLSTLEAIAKAFGLPLALLLMGEPEIRAICGLIDKNLDNPIKLPLAEQRQIQRGIGTGMLRDRAEVVRIVAQRVGELADAPPLAVLIAGLFAGFIATQGVVAGTALGTSLHEASVDRSESENRSPP